MSLSLTSTQDIFQFFPSSMCSLFESEIVPVIESMFKHSSKQNPLDYSIGARLMKLTVLLINNMTIGMNLLVYILNETDGIFARGKDG